MAPVAKIISRRLWVLGASAAALGASLACKPKAGEPDGSFSSPYLDIGETLARDELDGLGQLGAQIVRASEARADEPGVAEILAAVGRIDAADISTARLAYRKMSEGMIAWLAADPSARKGMTLIHCPMTFADEGAYWVQRKGRVANPYEGAMMLRCGVKIPWDDYRRGAPPAGSDLGLEVPSK